MAVKGWRVVVPGTAGREARDFVDYNQAYAFFQSHGFRAVMLEIAIEPEVLAGS